MPIDIWKTPNGKWFWTCRATNGEVISDSSEIYSTRQKATQGAEATAKEFTAWLAERKRKSRKQSKKPRRTSAPRKPGAKRSTSSSKPTRTTARRKG